MPTYCNTINLFRVINETFLWKILKSHINCLVVKRELYECFIRFLTADWLRQCSKTNPIEDDCFRKMFEGMFPMLAKGI